MASLTIIDQACANCGARATRELRDRNYELVGTFCTKHAGPALVAQTTIDREQAGKLVIPEPALRAEPKGGAK